jgi:predicted negative regulator of RcsB-dependent stress response
MRGMTAGLRFSDRKVFLGLVLMAVVILAVFGVVFWEYLSASVTESEEAVRSFVQALDHYDANATWGLMSTALQESYGTMESFNSTVLGGLRQSGWHAETMNMTVKANFTLPGSMVQNSAYIVASLRIAESGLAPTNQTYSFELIKPSRWRIDKWSSGQ